MATLKKRLGASIFLTILSLATVILLLVRSNSNVHTQTDLVLQKIGLGSVEGYTDLLRWGTTEDDEDDEVEKGEGMRVVVFGDSWVSDEHGIGGRSWAGILCQEIKCSSYHNFAVAQSADEYPANPPTGAVVSDTISRQGNATLPDLAAQIQSFIELPVPEEAGETLFVVSTGFWDIYTFASLDKELGENLTDTSINALFANLDTLYTHYATSLPSSTNLKPQFRILLPKVLDPSLSPGWLSLRPLPLKPSSIAEEQKNAAYLTARWNLAIENRLTMWLKSSSEIAASKTKEKPKPDIPREDVRGFTSHYSGAVISAESRRDDQVQAPGEGQVEVLKDAFYYDLPSYLLDIIIEHQLEDEGLSDASGLGTGESPYESVYEPCVAEVEGEPEGGLKEVGNGMWECVDEGEFLWWDGFNIGSKARRDIGEEVAEMVEKGKSLRSSLGMGYGNRVGGV